MSLPRYPKYKDSGVEWLGGVPGHWEVWKLAQAFEVIGSGTTPKSDNRSYYDEGDIAWLNTGDLNDGELDSCEKRITPLALADHSSLKTFPAGSLVIAMYGATIGKLAILLFPATVNQACCVFSGRSPIETKFMFYWFLGLRQQIISLATGGGQPNVSQEILRSLRVACPDEIEQNQIATFLDRETAKIDELVAEQRRLMALLKEKRQAVISHAVTRGLNPDAPLKPSGIEWLGDVPEHWEVGALGYLATVSSGSTPDRGNPAFWGGDIPWIKTGEIDYLPICRAEEFITTAGLHGSSAKMSEPGTMLMAMYGQGVTRGRVAILEVAAAYNQACAAISLGNRIDNKFAQNFFIAAYHFIRDTGNETSQMNLSTGIIQKFQLTIPPIDEQIEINSFLDKEVAVIDTLTTEAQRAIDLLQERRTALISAAVTGQIDVRGAVAA
jgi:type I restriction enzyme S subunit